MGRGRDTGGYRNSDCKEDQGQQIREESHSSYWEREPPSPPPTDLQFQPFLPWQQKLCQETESIFGHFITKVSPQIDTYISFAWR